MRKNKKEIGNDFMPDEPKQLEQITPNEILKSMGSNTTIPDDENASPLTWHPFILKTMKPIMLPFLSGRSSTLMSSATATTFEFGSTVCHHGL